MTKTRILRLLLLSAVALPLCLPAGAQEGTMLPVKEAKTKEFFKFKNLNSAQAVENADADDVNKETKTKKVNEVSSEPIKVNQAFKAIKRGYAVAQPKTARVVKVTKAIANVPEGYSQITLNVLDTQDAGTGVWNDGTGYQMLLDADHNTFGSIIPEVGALTTSGDVPASTYAEFEYKIPENADGALATTNMILSGTSSITIPSGTYDWCITNPTPEDRMWIASENGSVQGRYNDFVFESGFAYTFTISLVGKNDNIVIDVVSKYENPTNLEVSEISNHQATLTWNPGAGESSWNVEYKKKTDYLWTDGGIVSSSTYLLNNLEALTKYQFRVKGIFGDGFSGWSLMEFKTIGNELDYCDPYDMGHISYTLGDSYGDGWGHSAINIYDAQTGGIIESLTFESGSSAEGTISICYGREVYFSWVSGDSDDECSFTIQGPNGEVIYSSNDGSSLSDGQMLASYTMQMPEQTEMLDFGTIDVNTRKTLYANFYHHNNTDVLATVTATAPFSVASSTVTLLPGINNIPVTFAPTSATNYNSTLTVDINGEIITIALKGVGNMSGPEAVRDEAFFEGITYTWTDSEGTHTSNLAEVATKPEQIIALLKEVYTNQDIPGNLKRGYTATGGTDTYSDVSYSGVGSISRASGGTYSYNDNLGWNISNKTAFKNTTSNNYTFTYMDPTDYKPNVEGVTLLLVESTDDFDAEKYDWPSGTGYNYLKSMVGTTIKSVRVVTSSMRTGEGQGRGTLFKVDCDKMNKFFFLGKGQLRWTMDSYYASYYDSFWGTRYLQSTACPEPCYIYRRNSAYNGWHDDEGTSPLFSHMFEQFSPVSLNTGANIDDLYQSLINMQSFGVYHDCLTVPFAYSSSEPEGERHGHQFMMYGLDSEAADCQDVRDLMFFVPDYRMMKDDNRDPDANYAKFVNYNTAHQPTMGLYVIRQNEITPTTAADDYYMLNLNWVTNLDDFLPSEDQEFELLQIVVNEDGVEEYVPVYYMNASGEYTDANSNVVDEANKVPIVLHLGAGAEKNYQWVYVARQTSSQQVTYAIRGRDTGHFLSLQTSNRQSYIIPGTDPQELVSLIELSHYSRYNPDLEENCYSNRFKLSNNVGGVTRGNLSADQGSQNVFTFTRKTSSTDVNPVTIATATVTATNTSGGTITIEMQNQAAETEFPKAKTGNGYAGYHANPGNGTWTINFTYDKINNVDYVDFGDLVICDNFVVDVSNNQHPSQYIYEVKFNVVPDNSVENHNFDEAHGSAFRVPIYKTASRINNTYTAAEVSGDMDRSIEVEDLTFGERVQYSSKTEILRYDVYRWNSTEQKLYIVDEVYSNDTEQDLPPDGIAGNQGEGYTVSMNDVNGQYYYDGGTVNVSSQGLTFVDFVDYYPARVAESSGEASAYIYAPVVETFTTGKSSVGVKRTDYNTYGGPQKVAAVGVLDVKVQQPDVNSESDGYMSSYNWTNDGKTYAYYKVPLTISKKDVPAGYGIYKIRAWREIDAQYLNEEHADVSDEIARRMDSSYPFEDITFDPNVQNPAAAMDAIDELGVTEKTLEGVTTVAKTYTTGTFGAQKVGDGAGEIAELPMKFYVRIYFTREANLPVAQTSNAPRLKDATAADGKYYIVEKEIPFSITKNNIITAIDQLNARQVAGVKYYNVAGVESDRPFHGVNIVVTRYTDGSMTTTKVVK